MATETATTGTETTTSSGHLDQARAQDQSTIAWVDGESVKQLPTDLYIPPEALEVFLDTFEGPLDLLLYLILMLGSINKNRRQMHLIAQTLPRISQIYLVKRKLKEVDSQ